MVLDCALVTASAFTPLSIVRYGIALLLLLLLGVLSMFVAKVWPGASRYGGP